MSDHCETCRHWERRKDPGYLANDSPEAIAEYERWGYCERSGGDNGDPRHPDTLAYASDYESYKADLITRVNFGCVQWESKQEGDVK